MGGFANVVDEAHFAFVSELLDEVSIEYVGKPAENVLLHQWKAVMRECSDLDVHAAASIDAFVVPWIERGSASHIAVVASASVVDKITHSLLLLRSAPLSIVCDMQQRRARSVTLAAGPVLQLMVKKAGLQGTQALYDTYILKNDGARLSKATAESVQDVLPDARISPQPSITFSPSKAHIEGKASPWYHLRTSPSPNRAKQGAGISLPGFAGGTSLSLPLGARAHASGVPQPPRNMHLYDTSVMLRSIEKWDPVRGVGDAMDIGEAVSPPLGTQSRALDTTETRSGSRTYSFGGGSRLHLPGPIISLRTSGADTQSSSGAVTSPVLAHKGSAASVYSMSSTAPSASASQNTLSNVSAFAQSLFSHTSLLQGTQCSTQDMSSEGPPDTLWQGICLRLFPLFNGEPVGMPIEVVNEWAELYVRQLMVSQGPATPYVLEETWAKFCRTSTLGINARLHHLEGLALLQGVVGAWRMYYETIIPFLHAAIFPLESCVRYMADTMERSMLRTDAGPHGAKERVSARRHAGEDEMHWEHGSPVLSDIATSSSASIEDVPEMELPLPSAINVPRLDIQRALLLSFRDRVLLPISRWLLAAIAHIDELARFSPPFVSPRHGPQADQIEVRPKELRPYLLQLTGVLVGLHTDDNAQERVEHLRNRLLSSLTSDAPLPLSPKLSPSHTPDRYHFLKVTPSELHI
ncbi:hypothetical protein MVES_000701 [Malassezia vespertilionis]|uniref:Uncharacterized protein n=1 Tax=Malassezia vespertilionis TaxID=2020962 RepID=A0A2N1JGK1_9BASI|nr:hypothetical protein MVES_000701 [Malassezia vespertilionis]